MSGETIQWTGPDGGVRQILEQHAAIVDAIRESFAVRNSTAEGYPVAVYFVNLEAAQKFNDAIMSIAKEIKE